MAAMISSRGRYALRVLADLARQTPGVYVPLKDIAAREELSQKYSEAIMTTLSKGGLVEGIHGKGGGYRLSRKPEEYSLAEILTLTEGSLAPVSCLCDGASPCDRSTPCPTLPVWEELERIITEYLSSVTLADILPKE
ncbi:MAG: RrF2 family transcriptional regulator [Candidatus Faecousia sp.]|jgi:Rrf2 family protein|nr:RrF2 family transcriptional regulator [Candidatus Faecousia sp.]